MKKFLLCIVLALALSSSLLTAVFATEGDDPDVIYYGTDSHGMGNHNHNQP